LFLAVTKRTISASARHRSSALRKPEIRVFRSASFSHDRFVLSSLPVFLPPETFPRFMLAANPHPTGRSALQIPFTALLAVSCYIALAIQRKTRQRASIIAARPLKSAILWE